jgi:hypothetical protein
MTKVIPVQKHSPFDGRKIQFFKKDLRSIVSSAAGTDSGQGRAWRSPFPAKQAARQA